MSGPPYCLVSPSHVNAKTDVTPRHSVGSCEGSIMSSSMSSLIFSSNFDLMLNGVLSIGCATSVTLGSMWSCTARSFNFPTPLKTFGYFCCRSPPMVVGFALTAATPIPIFSTPRLVAVLFPQKGVSFTINHTKLGTSSVASCRDFTGKCSYHIKLYSSELIHTSLCFSSTTPMFPCQ